MDGRGRFAQSLTRIVPWITPWRARPRGRGRVAPQVNAHVHTGGRLRPAPGTGRAGGRLMRRCSIWLFNLRVPSGAGLAASALFLLATLAYGVVVGDRVPAIVGTLKDARDAAANEAGFRIASIALSGERHVSREEILAAAGVTGTTSLLFFDVEEARDRLKT